MKVEFMKNDEGTRLLAIYVAQLTREGIAYQVDNKAATYEVIATGH